MGMPRIAWIEDDDAEGETAAAFARARAVSSTGQVAAILRTMSLRPEFMEAINAASRLHFTDGALTRAQHEMIASYVAAINRCHY
jgi:alkylhydroperoxidase family enzyme